MPDNNRYNLIQKKLKKTFAKRHDGELAAFDVRRGRGRLPDALSGKIYDTNPVFNTGANLYAFDGTECLVSIAHNRTTAIGTSCRCPPTLPTPSASAFA